MKTNKLAIMFLIMFVSASLLGIYGQGANLQFNRIVQLNCHCTYPGHPDSLRVTVPANKIWKIESALCPSTGASQSLSIVKINGISCPVQLAGSFITYTLSGHNRTYEAPHYPIWLNQNDVIVFNCWNDAGGNLFGIINVVEYNIVP